MTQQQTPQADLVALAQQIAEAINPPTGNAYRVVAEWSDGRTWTRRFFTKASALRTRKTLLNPDPRDEWGTELAYPVPAIRVEIQVATIGPWAPFEEATP